MVSPGDPWNFITSSLGGFNGQISVVGFTLEEEVLKILLYSLYILETWLLALLEESKASCSIPHKDLLPWDDLHHIAISDTNCRDDARWAYLPIW